MKIDEIEMLNPLKIDLSNMEKSLL